VHRSKATGAGPQKVRHSRPEDLIAGNRPTLILSGRSFCPPELK
jgi:hypothetical protein